MKIDTYTILVIAFGIGFFIFFTQPVWRPDALIEEFKTRCDKNGGEIGEVELRFGTEYQCIKKRE